MAATKADIERELAQVRREFEEFKETVRDRVVNAIENSEICRDGGNEALQEFGLEPVSITLEGSYTVTFSFSDLKNSGAGRYSEWNDDDLTAFNEFLDSTLEEAVKNADFEQFGPDLTVYFDCSEIDPCVS